MSAQAISLVQARRLALRRQYLDGGRQSPTGKEGTAQLIEALGYVQIDTIAVIQRAHHHVLWTRRPQYTPAELDQLLAKDRRIFEYWTHAASYVPMADYRYYLPRMAGCARSERHQEWCRQNRKVLNQVRRRVRQEGPLGSTDFVDTTGKRGPWWGWKPAKRALETLFDSGELMIDSRHKFQRRYDLAERILPPGTDTTTPTLDEHDRFFVRRALNAQSLCAIDQVRWGLWDKGRIRRALDDLVDGGEVVELAVEAQPVPYYALASVVQRTLRPRRKRPVYLLSPFDNLVIDRKRVEALFDFHYRIECYTPAAKRQYGYFTLPILWGDRLVGRLDPKAERKTRTFYGRNLVFEPGFSDFADLLPDLAQGLVDFAGFNGCDQVVVEKTAPAKVKAPLRKALAQIS